MVWDPEGTCSLETFVASTCALMKPTEVDSIQLPFHCQWQDLKDLFRSAGQIIRADVALGPDGRSRGFGTVLFANDADAATGVTMFNGYA
jgi:RNA recognition motif